MPLEPENFLKGRIAESLVEELLKNCGNKVYRFGFETVLQNLTQLEKSFNRDNEVGQRISSIPDFIVINQEGKPFFIEVKFRKDLSLVYRDNVERVELIEKFWKAKIIIITLQKPYFRVSSAPYLKQQAEWWEWSWMDLKQDKDLNINENILNQFNKLVEKYCVIEKGKKDKIDIKDIPF